MSESFEREKIAVHSLESRPAFQEGFSSVVVFKKMVKAFTGVDIKIKEVEIEKEFHKPIGNVKVKFDLFAEDEKNRLVGIDVVRSLYAVKSQMGVPNALIATTSNFTKSAEQFGVSRFDLSLIDYEAILEWINSYRPNPKGYLHVRDKRIQDPFEE